MNAKEMGLGLGLRLADVASVGKVATVGAVIRNVIFDWSGTLVDDLPAVLVATNHVLQQAGLPAMSRDRFRAEFKLPFTGFYERYTPDIPMERLEGWFHAAFREAQHTVEELPHAREFLEFCQARGLRTLLLSTMHPDHYAVQTAVNGFDRWLQHPYLGVWDKREKIHEILRIHGLEPSETVFIGDMEHDIETARHGGILSVGVLTGYNSSEQLRRAGPDLLVEHLGELRAVLERNGLRLHPEDAAGAAAARRPVVTVGAAIFDRQGRVLMVRTHKWSNRWGIPGGKVHFGERCEDALVRELREETGLEVDDVRFVLVQDCIHSQEFYRDDHFVLLNYRCVAGAPEPVRLNDEAQEYRWLPPGSALELDLNRPTRVLLEALGAGNGTREA
jgi:phosphoglycolate phosphatase-like HAD superfamily hydrolase/ADP-ribose pyrophosphatase YjhB (NUDIX family)